MKTDILKKIKDGGTVLGTHCFIGEPMITEEMARCGFDVIWICMEHTAIGKKDVLYNLIAANGGGANAFVRVAWNDPVLVKPVIDMGPDGIIFPYIRTADDARLAVASCTYPPAGVRGWGPQRAADYGAVSQKDFSEKLYRKTLRIIQIEHIDAVNNLESILSVDGIDGFVVGQNDLSASVGHLDDPNGEEMQPVYDRIGKILAPTGKLFGVSMAPIESCLKKWLSRGANCLFCGTDIDYIHTGAADVKARFDKIT